MNSKTVLSLEGITKSFPGVQALESVALDIAAGEVVALIGENGAGKSTLMKILAGIHQPEAGTIRIGGEPARLHSPRDAARHGIAVIHQELELVETLDVAANVFLGREPVHGGPLKLIDAKRMRAETQATLDRLRAPFSPRAPVAGLSLAHRQLVEIARALSMKAQILLMDEPTSSLTSAETERLLEVVRELRAGGVSVIYISHRLGEVQAIADRVVVLRDGRNAGTLRRGEITHDAMIRLMVGRDLQASRRGIHESLAAPHAVFEFRNFRTRRYPDHEVSLAVHGGEILGIAGLVGAGRSELAQAVFGIELPLSGALWTDETMVPIRSPRDAIRNGIYLVPEDRRQAGLLTAMTVRENVTLPRLRQFTSAGWIKTDTECAAARQACMALAVKAPSIESTAACLSGGNQQKVVLAKWLSLEPRLILFDEPTRGIDVGAKAEIYAIMRRLADQGVAIVMISSDMEEILANSDRVAVMHEGRVTGVLPHAECSQEAIMRLAVA